MSTEVAICSNALLMLGDSPISDLGEDNDRARLCFNLFPIVLDSVLRSHPWNCCAERIVLSPDITAPAFGYTYRFLLPTDFVRMITCGQEGEEVDYRIESGWILADQNPLYVRYMAARTVDKFDMLLTKALTIAMSAELAYPITASSAKEQMQVGKLNDILRQARAADGQDNPPETMGDFPLYRSRFGNFPSGR